MSEIVTLNEVYNLTDFATNNLWYMDFIKMPTTYYSITPAELHMRCQSFSMPATTVQDLAVTLHNHVKHQSAKTVQPVSITIPFIETQDMRTTKWLVSWREACSQTNTNYVSIPSARQATIQFYTYTGQQQMNFLYRISYCELRNIGNIEYGNGSDVGAIVRSAEIQVGLVEDNLNI